jgi:aryl-alcohol dehydrogenase-like predicted oxidoreductase
VTVERELRQLGKTGWQVSSVGFGAWQIGADWGDVSDAGAMDALHAAADAGINFFDTADVYGDGRSERLVGRLLRERDEHLFVATKTGRRAPLSLEHYTQENLRSWIDRSRENLGLESLGLVQLHCLPSPVYDSSEVFESLEELVSKGVIEHYGVSVETVDEGLRALQWPGLATIQVVFNIFRQKPSEQLLDGANRSGVGIIARVPLASGLLTGKLRADTSFPENDHRNYNRHGEAFDVGETFAGVDFDKGLATVERLRPLVPEGESLVNFALRWVLTNRSVSTVIPGARNAEQARGNAAASGMPPLDDETMRAIAAIYDEDIAPLVQHRW